MTISEMRELDLSTTCPICKTNNPWKDPVTEFVVECKVCGASRITLTPMLYQLRVIHDHARFLQLAGAYGTGKTIVSAYKLLLKWCRVDNAMSVVMAQTLDQLKDTFMTELTKLLPMKLIQGKKLPKLDSAGEFSLVNGHVVKLTASVSAQKLRGRTLVCIHMEEASGIKEDIYKEAIARMRAGGKSDEETDFSKRRTELLAEETQLMFNTNPSAGWTFDQAIGRDINPKNLSKYDLPLATEPTTSLHSSHIWASENNRYLPEGFVEGMKAQYSPSEYAILVEANFTYQMGRIVANLPNLIVEDLENKVDMDHMPVLCGLDFGQGDKGDNQAFTVARVDFDNRRIYVVDEIVHPHQETIKNKVKAYNELLMKKYAKSYVGTFYDSINGGVRGRERVHMTLVEMYREAGMKNMHKSNNARREYGLRERVELLLSYTDEVQVIIDTKCEWLIKELRSWSYDDVKPGVPVDKDNHSIDSLLFILMMIGKRADFETLNARNFRYQYAKERLETGDNYFSKLYGGRKRSYMGNEPNYTGGV